MLVKILSASFRHWVRPRNEALIHAVVTTNEERYARAECRVEVAEQTVAQANLISTHEVDQSRVTRTASIMALKRGEPEGRRESYIATGLTGQGVDENINHKNFEVQKKEK